MQILGKRSKVLLIAVAIAMLVALGVSFAAWDSMSTVKAVTGNASVYANAKVGEVIEFGEYYQSKTNLTKKDPIKWIVVDKDERTGQLTLLSKHILACGSYFGNYYDAGSGYGWNYNAGSTAEVGGVPYNQAYVDSTVRAYLNNLERLDLGGDAFETGKGYVPSAKNSTTATGLFSSVGFSNQRYWTGLNTGVAADLALVNKKIGLVKRSDNTEIYYQRPISNAEYTNRPAAKGFFDEAFDNEQKSMIVPKVIAGYTGYRWPDNAHDISTKSYVEGAYDKVWLPSTTELNIKEGQDWASQPNDAWTNPSDEAGSTVFEYFKDYKKYGFASVTDAVKATRTDLATDGKAGNFSIPVYDKETMNVKTAISNETDINSSNHYWTRSPSSNWYRGARYVRDSGLFDYHNTVWSHVGVRPCVILKY